MKRHKKILNELLVTLDNTPYLDEVPLAAREYWQGYLAALCEAIAIARDAAE